MLISQTPDTHLNRGDQMPMVRTLMEPIVLYRTVPPGSNVSWKYVHCTHEVDAYFLLSCQGCRALNCDLDVLSVHRLIDRRSWAINGTLFRKNRVSCGAARTQYQSYARSIFEKRLTLLLNSRSRIDRYCVSAYFHVSISTNVPQR